MKSILRLCSIALTAGCLLAASTASAQIFVFTAALDGPSESPPNASPGTGFATITFNLGLHTMRVQATFSGLTGNTTASHIHAATAAPFTSTAPVATQTPSFSGFPLGVTAGSYDNTFDLTLASSFNASYITANGGTPAGAEAALINHSFQGRAYFNVHSSTFGGGEIRGFLIAVPEPATVAAGVGALGLVGAGWLRRRKG